MWNGPTGALHRNCVQCARHIDPGGGGVHRGSKSAHTGKGHAARTPRATETEPAEHKDCMEWRTNRLRERKPGRDNPQHAPRGARGGEKREPAPAPSPLTCRGRRAHTNRALRPPKAVAPQGATHRPHGWAASAPALWGSHCLQASSTGPAARAPPGDHASGGLRSG